MQKTNGFLSLSLALQCAARNVDAFKGAVVQVDEVGPGALVSATKTATKRGTKAEYGSKAWGRSRI